MIQTICFEQNAVFILDQNQLPAKLVYERCISHEELVQAIRDLKVRGAPLIGVTAAFGLALAVKNYSDIRGNIEPYYSAAEQLFASSRPTAINLFGAIQRMRSVFDTALTRGMTIPVLADHLLQEAQKMFAEDVANNNSIGEYGQELLQSGCQVLTICNAGVLATCGYGTALGVVRSAHKRSKIKRVWACETRPVLQGSRLTVWELMQDEIPVTLITDSMAAYVMSLKHIDAVIVGADRIAANGDVANKIGTYSLAVLANHHNIPFYVAAPLSTIDPAIFTGLDIPIEERNSEEVRQIQGNYLTVPEVEVFNPAFDVTPGILISAIITEKGIIRAPFTYGLKQIQEEGER